MRGFDPLRLLNALRPSEGHHRLTKRDEQLLRVVDRLGGTPDEPTADWWREVGEAWKAAGLEELAPDSHRVRWARLQVKVEEFGPDEYAACWADAVRDVETLLSAIRRCIR